MKALCLRGAPLMLRSSTKLKTASKTKPAASKPHLGAAFQLTKEFCRT
jgi:hypothetical protein